MTKAMPHQANVIPDMLRGNKMLVWEPGTGKTYPVLVASMFLDGPTLVICPAHLREQWAEQAATHAPLLIPHIFADTKRAPKLDWLDAMDIVIVSYEYVAVLERWKELRQVKWSAIAIDEAHYLMNLDANRTRAILGAKPLTQRHGLVHAADYVWPLTGTPFTFPNQIYPLLAALFPSSLTRPERNGPGAMTEREWENEFCVFRADPDGFGEKVVGAKNIPELRARLAPYLDKIRLKDVVKDMPPLTIDTIPIRGKLTDLTKGLDPELIQAYQGLTNTLLDDSIPDDEKLAAVEDSGLVMAQLRHHIAVAKIKQTLEIVRGELEGGVKKLLLLGWHTRPLIEVADALDAPIIYGDLTPKAKALAKEEFIEDDRCSVLCGQVSAVATGTDGLQAVCHRGLFMETPWTFRDNKQGWHRLYRKGQKLPVHWSYITLLGSVDEYVARVFRRNAEIVKLSLD